MPPASKRNASVILFDVNTSPEFAEASKKCLLNICASKWFLESKDCTKLILLNTKETNNSIHTKFGKCPHVYEATDVINYDPKLLQPHIEDVETGEADWLMGLTVALDEIKTNFSEAKGVMTLQLLFITDFSTKTQAKERQIKFVIDHLNNLNVFLYILGPEVKIPHMMTNYDDIREWSKNIEFIKNENPNFDIAKRIVENTKNSIICDLELGQELFKCYINQWGLQPWKVPLTIGTSLTFNTSTTRFLRPATAPKMKKQSLSEYNEPWKWHMIDDVLEEVAYEDVIGGVLKHNKFIPLPADVEKGFKYNGLRCFKIVGFTDKKNVSEYYMYGNGPCYVESNGSRGFQLLIEVLAKKNKVVIARRVYMANSRPKLVALLPQPDHQVFILVELPCADDIRTQIVEQDIKNEASEVDQSNNVNELHNFLEKLDISDPKNRDLNDNVKIPLGPNLMDSWKHKLVAKRCLQKYLGNEMDFFEINLNLPEFSDDVADYKQYFPLHPVVATKKRSSD